MKEIKIFFNKALRFEPNNIRPLMGVIGLYFIFLKKLQINYPFKNSGLIYIGMSEKRSNSIGQRLLDHCEGRSGNSGLKNYGKMHELFFTYLNYEMLRKSWLASVEDLESYFILDFVENYGVYPICNNKTNYDITQREKKTILIVDWTYFDIQEGGNNE